MSKIGCPLSFKAEVITDTFVSGVLNETLKGSIKNFDDQMELDRLGWVSKVTAKKAADDTRKAESSQTTAAVAMADFAKKRADLAEARLDKVKTEHAALKAQIEVTAAKNAALEE